MDTRKTEIERENSSLRNQLGQFQSELEKLRDRIGPLVNENESLRRTLRERQPNTPLNLDKDSLLDIHNQQRKLLEEEKEGLTHLYQESREIILRLEQEINDLKNPLKPHLIRLEMQTKQAQEEHVRAEEELFQEVRMIREELTKRNRELVTSQLRTKELEHQNQTLQAEIYQKEDDLRRNLRKEIGYDGTLVAFQTSIDSLEVRLEHALKEKENAQLQHHEIESRLKDLTQQHRALQEKFAETLDQLQQQQQYARPARSGTADPSAEHNRVEHERMHRTIDELIEQAAMKTRDAVEEVRQQYNDNLEKIMEEYNRLETELNQKQLELDKCLRAKRSLDEELDKILQERRLNLEKSTLDNEDLAKRCFHAERERDETQLKLEQVQQAQKLLQQNFEAEKSGHQARQQELSDRVQKVTIDLDRTTADYTTTFTELNELKKKLSSTQNEQMMSQRRMTDLIKRHEEQMLEKEKDCLARLTQRDEVNRTTFNELRNLVNRQQRMIVKYKEECHTIASQSEAKINELKQKIEHLRTRNEQLQSDMADVKRKDAEMNRVLTKNANRIKTLEERLQDAEEQAVEASRRVAKQLVRDRLAVVPNDHYSYASVRPHQSSSLFNLTSLGLPSAFASGSNQVDSIEHLSNGN